MAKATKKTAKQSDDATATATPDKPETFETRRGWLFRSITQQLTARGFDAKIERKKDCIAAYYELHLTRNGYRVSLEFRCDEHCTGSSSWELGSFTGWPEVKVSCTSPSVNYAPKVKRSNGTYTVTQGVNVTNIVERFELAFEQHRARDEREREKVAKLAELLTEARRINGALGREIVGITEGDNPELVIRMCHYRGDKIELMAAILATDAMLPVVQSVGDSLDRLERRIQHSRKELSERFTDNA